MESSYTIRYAGGGNQDHAQPTDYRNIGPAIKDIQLTMESEGFVFCEFQPGDGTRYRLFFMEIGDGLVVGTPDHNWCKQVADHRKRPGVTVPDYLRDYGREKRLCPHTASLIAEVLRLAFGDGSESVPFYLFEPETGEPRANIPQEVR